MARARNIKPAFFKNEALADSGCETRLLFIGLWTLADREGRLEDRPRRIRAEIFPFDGFDVESMLVELQRLGFLSRYEVDGNKFIQITNFVKHQDPHYREKASDIPPMPGAANEIVATGVTRTQRARILERDDYKCQQCGSTEHPCIDHVIPVSRGGDSSDDNLQVLCLPCNTKKGNKIDSTSSQRRVDVGSIKAQDAPLIPDSLNLIPDSLIPEEAASLPAAAVALPCPTEKIVDAYHELMPLNPMVKVLNDTRKKAIRARWLEASALGCKPFGYKTQADGLAAWRAFFVVCAESKFLTGRATPQPGKAPFLADIEFLMSPSGFAKCLENKYHREHE
jgi:hypothetical protein